MIKGGCLFTHPIVRVFSEWCDTVGLHDSESITEEDRKELLRVSGPFFRVVGYIEGKLLMEERGGDE
jgi:hypothetical protein